jgi:hypothetical protein
MTTEYNFNVKIVVSDNFDGQVVSDALDSALSSIDSNLWELGFPEPYAVYCDGQPVHEFKGE